MKPMTKTVRRLLLLPALFVAASCGHEGKNLSGVHQAEPPQGQGAPPPHPSANPHEGMGAQTPNPHGVQPPAAPVERPVTWTAPQGWTESPPTSGMRLAQFDIGKSESGAPVQVVVFTGIGGDDRQNLDRWIEQMGTTKDAAKESQSEQDGVKVTRLEAHGTFTNTMGGADAKTPDSTMLAAIVTTQDGAKLHVKLVGPTSVVAAQTANFDAFVASIRSRN
jgi:hypothetical protein